MGSERAKLLAFAEDVAVGRPPDPETLRHVGRMIAEQLRGVNRSAELRLEAVRRPGRPSKARFESWAQFSEALAHDPAAAEDLLFAVIVLRFRQNGTKKTFAYEFTAKLISEKGPPVSASGVRKSWNRCAKAAGPVLAFLVEREEDADYCARWNRIAAEPAGGPTRAAELRELSTGRDESCTVEAAALIEVLSFVHRLIPAGHA